jgi:hypothetical protein
MSRRSSRVVAAVVAAAAALVALAYETGTSGSSESPTIGSIPSSAFTNDGLDGSKMPDFVGVLDRSGNVAGYVSKEDLLPPEPGTAAPIDAPLPVVDESLTRVVGHLYPGRGFVAVGESAGEVPPVAVTTSPPPG